MEDGRDALGGGVAGKRRTAGKGFVEDRAEREEVRPLVQDLPLELLRGHVAESPHDSALLGQGDRRERSRVDLLLADEAGDPEVEELRQTVAGDHDVFRLDVAMQHARGVGVNQGLEQASDEDQRLRQGKRSAPQPLAQGLPGDELHGEVDDAGGLPRLVESRDRGMLQPGARLSFAHEPVPGVGSEREKEHLDRRAAAEREIVGEKDLAHAARAEPLPDPIVGERLVTPTEGLAEPVAHERGPRGHAVARRPGVGEPFEPVRHPGVENRRLEAIGAQQLRELAATRRVGALEVGEQPGALLCGRVESPLEQGAQLGPLGWRNGQGRSASRPSSR